MEIPYEEFSRLKQYEHINAQYRTHMSYRVSTECSREYGYPTEPMGWGFDTTPLPNTAFLRMVKVMTASAHSPIILDERGDMLDIGLTSPGTLAGGILRELCRRLMVYERREQLGRLNASRRTDHREVGG